MAVHIQGIFSQSLNDKINSSKVLVVGAGGIGCELLKNLVLTGFENLHVIDLDTIELSNLNRQFLFHKQHIGRPKAVVAKESVLKFNPKAQITAYHDSIKNAKYDVEFFRQFTAVVNALDNVAARSHVNRMCLAADIPLIESGSAGYVGQVTVYKRGVSECFECLPRKSQKVYPGCTIRNTPSEPVHCIVWAKHLFNQLFGETDADEEVSPDFADPELDEAAANGILEEVGNVSRVSTREWAKSSNYDSMKIFNKLYGEDMDYLNKMTDLWKERKRPERLDYDSLPDAVPGTSEQTGTSIKDQVLWSVKQCADLFCSSLTTLKSKVEDSGPDTVLYWDKDDEVCMDFVASCANLRSYCFGIAQKSKFDIKAIAGNIIPAIATTNAVIAGLIVLQLIKVMKGDFSQCRTAWLKESATGGKILPSSLLEKPNPDCYVCSTKTPEVVVALNVNSLTIRTLEEKVLKDKLHMTQPDVVVNDGTGTIIISSDPEDMDDAMMDKALSEFGIKASTRLSCEDFLQHYKVILVLKSSPDLKDQEFEMDADVDHLMSQQDEKKTKVKENDGGGPGSSAVTDVEEDIVMSDPSVEELDAPTSKVGEVESVELLPENKRKASDDENEKNIVAKKRKTDPE